MSLHENCLFLFFLCSFYIIPELNLIYFLINKDPAPGPTGGLQPQEKDLTQALVRHHPPREARSEVVLDLLHLVIAKKDDRDHGHPKGLGLCRIRMGVFKCVILFFSEDLRFTGKQLNLSSSVDIKSSFLPFPVLLLHIKTSNCAFFPLPSPVKLPPVRNVFHRKTWVTILSVCESVNVYIIDLFS